MSSAKVKDSPTSSGSLKSVKSGSSSVCTPISSAESIHIAEDNSQVPEFIYGGPFIKKERAEPFLNTATPMNLQLQGTFKKSFAYYSLKERLPIILTKVIDYLSRDGAKIQAAHKATAQDTRSLIQHITKIKNDLITNKEYVPLNIETEEAQSWNKWIEASPDKRYFLNTWVFSECYVYRRLREGCELIKNLQNFDPFDAQKDKSFEAALEPMCVVAEKVQGMLAASDKDKRKQDFITLLKLALWSNKCDLSLSLGEVTSAGGQTPAGSVQALSASGTPAASNQSLAKSKEISIQSQPPPPLMDPFEQIVSFKDKVLVDDSAKIADQVVAKAENMAKVVEAAQKAAAAAAAAAAPAGKGKGAPPPPPPPPPAEPAAGAEEAAPEPPPPCPTKVTVPSTVQFDIVCDNAGYELFTDLCLAHFLISQNIVKKVRFHVKKIPWFVSDVTPRDFNFVIDSCAKANYSRTVPAEVKPGPPPGDGQEAPAEPRVVSSQSLQALGAQWRQFVQEEVFVVMCDDFWTSPHVYKDMKKYDYWMYRKLQFAVAILFKGDLNYRKLLGERNCNPYLGFEPALQGFIPAPIIALRTVKADLICGLPKGKMDALNKIDEKWMEKGDYGVIQFCAKAEPLKVADRPCAEYGGECKGLTCPAHTNFTN